MTTAGSPGPGACSAGSRARGRRSCCGGPTAPSRCCPPSATRSRVSPGDMLIYRTAGGGGSEGPARAAGRGGRARRVASGSCSVEGALANYGVVVGDPAATEAERARQRRSAGRRRRSTSGRRSRRRSRTARRRRAPGTVAGRAAALVAAGERGVGDGTGACLRGFGGAVGFGSRPAVVVVDLNRGFTDPSSPLACDLDEVLVATRSLLDVARAPACPCSSRRSSTTTWGSPPRPCSCARRPPCGRARRGRRGSRSTRGQAGRRPSR